MYGSLRDPFIGGTSGVRVPTGPFHRWIIRCTGPYGTLFIGNYLVYGSLRDPFHRWITWCTGPYGTLSEVNYLVYGSLRDPF